MLLISSATPGRRVIKLDDGNTEKEKAETGGWGRQATAAVNWGIITANSSSMNFKSLFVHN